MQQNQLQPTPLIVNNAFPNAVFHQGIQIGQNHGPIYVANEADRNRKPAATKIRRWLGSAACKVGLSLVARENRVKELRACLNQYHSVFLSGMPGVGKSSLVSCFCEQEASHFDGGIWWLNSVNFLQSQITLANDLGFDSGRNDPSKDVTYKYIADYVQEAEGKILIVVENADNVSRIDEAKEKWIALAQETCKVVITTRRKADVQNSGLVELDVLPADAAVKLLFQLGSLSDEKVENLTDEDSQSLQSLACGQLGCLPLGIVLLGKAKRHSNLSWTELLEQWIKHAVQDENDYSGVQSLVTTTDDTERDRFARQVTLTSIELSLADLDAAVKDRLMLVAFWGAESQPVPKRWLGQPQNLDKDLAVLTMRNLVSEADANLVFSHSLVVESAWILLRKNSRSRLLEAARRVVDEKPLELGIDERRQRLFCIERFCIQRGSPITLRWADISLQDTSFVELLDLYIGVALDTGLYAIGISIYKVFDHSQDFSAGRLQNFATLLLGQGKFQEAEQAFLDAIRSLRDIGDEHGRLCAQSNYARNLIEMGKNADTAEMMLKEAIEGLEGDDAESARFQYACFLWRVKHDSAQAAQMFESVLKGSRSFISCAVNLGQIYLEQSRIPQARATLEEAVSLLRDPRHRNEVWLGKALNNLALVDEAETRLDDATKHLEEACKIQLKLHGAQHADYATALHNLSGIFRKKRLLLKALDHETRALDIRRACLTSDHMDIILSLEEIARINKDLKSYEKCYEAAHEALDLRLRLSPGSAETVNILTLCAGSAVASSRQDAMTLCQRAVEHLSKGNDHQLTCDMLINCAYLSRTDTMTCRKYCDEVLAYCEMHPNLVPGNTSLMFIALETLISQTHHPKDASELAERAVVIARRLESKRLPFLLAQFGIGQRKSGFFEHAEANLREAYFKFKENKEDDMNLRLVTREIRRCQSMEV